MIKQDKLWLVGAGSMALNYSCVLSELQQSFQVIGRGEQSANRFELASGRKVTLVANQAKLFSNGAPQQAIVAVSVESLPSVTAALIKGGTKWILLEKPASLNFNEAYSLHLLAKKFGTKVFVAYNRRYYSSVELARRLISKDGGVLSINFEFTEWAHKVGPQAKGPGVKERWLISNSSHVIDLAFHIAGRPLHWKSWHSGFMEWHPSSARFCGAGITDRRSLFSYFADWESPGRWRIEVMTSCRRLILSPLEELKQVKHGCIDSESVPIASDLDVLFKPGLYKQTQAFLTGNDLLLCTLQEQVDNIKVFSKIAGYL